MTDEQRTLAENNMNLVHHLVHKYIKPSKDEYEDYSQEGMVGLCLAASRFDASKGFEFSTFAVPYILGMMKRYRRDNKLVRYSRKYQDNWNRITVYKVLHGEDCSNIDMLNELGITQYEFYEMICAKEVNYLDSTIDDREGSTTTLGETIPDRNWDAEFKRKQEESILKELEDELVSTLSDRDRDIYDDYFYSRLFGDNYPQEELASKYNCSQAQVSRVISKSNKKLLKMYKETL